MLQLHALQKEKKKGGGGKKEKASLSLVLTEKKVLSISTVIPFKCYCNPGEKVP